MKWTICHASPGRLRVRPATGTLSMVEADFVESHFARLPFVHRVAANDRTASVTIHYAGDEAAVREALAAFTFPTADDAGVIPAAVEAVDGEDGVPRALTAEESQALLFAAPAETMPTAPSQSRLMNHQLEERLFWHVAKRVFGSLFVPARIRAVIRTIRAIPYIWKGLKALARGRFSVDLLDATTIAISLIRGDFRTAGSIMFLLGLSEILEDWTHKKTVSDLAESMSLHVDNAWVRVTDPATGVTSEVLMAVSDIREGDLVILRTATTIPLDGIVVSGEASVNQASMTGESLPVVKVEGAPVYAGTVVEEGQCIIRVTSASGACRYDRILRMIDESEKLKSDTENRAVALANKLVPYSFLATGLTYLFTRNITRALSVMMVDYSCAMKLAMPISVMSAMNECARQHIVVKGGKFLENVSKAKTLVFDKTGTITHSTPTVSAVVPFDGNDETDMLRLAACLEEHFPHSLATAVVREAARRGIVHEEEHAKVEYIVAHGIVSSIEGKRVVLGSYHFVFEDEGCVIPRGEKRRFDSLKGTDSQLYMAIGGRLAAVICIADPIRTEAGAVINRLHELGFERIVMMTGDSYRTAEAVAAEVGVDEFFAEVLPEDKAAFVKREREAGRGVVMVGDGINDSPALSEADCGIAVSDGASIAREIADITIAEDSLWPLVKLRMVSSGLMDRIGRNYRFIMGFNSALILLGMFGVLQPTVSSYLHNGSTLAICMNAMTACVGDEVLANVGEA